MRSKIWGWTLNKARWPHAYLLSSSFCLCRRFLLFWMWVWLTTPTGHTAFTLLSLLLGWPSSTSTGTRRHRHHTSLPVVTVTRPRSTPRKKNQLKDSDSRSISIFFTSMPQIPSLMSLLEFLVCLVLLIQMVAVFSQSRDWLWRESWALIHHGDLCHPSGERIWSLVPCFGPFLAMHSSLFSSRYKI